MFSRLRVFPRSWQQQETQRRIEAMMIPSQIVSHFSAMKIMKFIESNIALDSWNANLNSLWQQKCGVWVLNSFYIFYWASTRQFFDGPSTSNRRILQCSTSHTRSSAVLQIHQPVERSTNLERKEDSGNFVKRPRPEHEQHCEGANIF